jgi:2-haloalkanoic acid dehalogenase type II
MAPHRAWHHRWVLIAFDVFGTLADTATVERELVPICGEQAATVASAWRARQLEYMFRATAMGLFPPFPDLTRWALSAVLAGAGVELPAAAELEGVSGAYRRLAPFPDVVPALGELHDRGHRLVAFSVGPRAWLEELTAGYRGLVDQIVSAEDAGVYKPHPGVYQHLLEATHRRPSDVVLVSSNPFDIIGAGAVGLGTAWCRRDPGARFDPWGHGPDHVVPSLTGLCGIDLFGDRPRGPSGLPVPAARARLPVGTSPRSHGPDAGSAPGQPVGSAVGPARYGEMTADVYDELYAGAFDTDAAVGTLAELAGDGALLDLGSGTGRLLIPLAERGVHVEGIEASPAMIARLHADPGGREVLIHEGDFADVAAPGPYRVIVAAVSTLFMLVDQQAQLRCMTNAANRLAPDGVLVVEAFVPDLRRYDARGVRTELRHLDGDRLHLVSSRHDVVNQQVHIEHVLVEGGLLRRYPVTLRYASPAELDLMATIAGLARHSRWGGWRREPFTASTTDHVTLYSRRA